MYYQKNATILFLFFISFLYQYSALNKEPTILLSIIARNDEHVLPFFLGYIEKLDYPKDRISIFIQTDHNIDSTFDSLSRWIENVDNLYHSINLIHKDDSFEYDDANGPNEWSVTRYIQLLKLRQKALDEARRQWADYILYIDSDNLLLNSDTLKILLNESRTIIAPMLRNFDSKSAYSNFWGGVDDRGYYRRVPEYFDILKWEKRGTFVVPMIHSTFLISLNDEKTDKIQFYPVDKSYTKSIDDILVFAHYAHKAGLDLHICNIEHFGYMADSPTPEMTLKQKRISFIDSIVDYTAYNDELVRSPNVPAYTPDPSYHGFDEIFMINLVRRADRYNKMNVSLKELGIKWKHFPAVDGKNFSKKIVKDMGVEVVSDFKDPYLKRPITFGEIGCFMSHWKIWQEVVERNLDTVLVLEDDVRFEVNFVNRLNEVMRQANNVQGTVNWDLIYTGRKKMSGREEQFVPGTDKLVYASYSYWTLGYILRLSGAKKLIAGDPLKKLVPVDEYIPIMFDDHTNVQLKKLFSPRNLIALSTEPLLMFPTHYVGDEGYISDTEDTLSHQEEEVEHFREAVKKMKESKKNSEGEKRAPSDEL